MNQNLTPEQQALVADLKEVYKKHGLMAVPIIHHGQRGELLPVLTFAEYKEDESL